MADRQLPRPIQIVLQIVAYGVFAAGLAYFSTQPSYRLRGDDSALVKLSFSHAAQLVKACRERSADELSKLAPNMRTKMDCPRERANVLVELTMDGKNLYQISTPPTGMNKDGTATVYRKLEIPAGRHRFHARLSDTADGVYGYTKDLDIELAPGQILIVDFLTGEGGFVFSRG